MWQRFLGTRGLAVAIHVTAHTAAVSQQHLKRRHAYNVWQRSCSHCEHGLRENGSQVTVLQYNGGECLVGWIQSFSTLHSWHVFNALVKHSELRFPYVFKDLVKAVYPLNSSSCWGRGLLELRSHYIESDQGCQTQVIDDHLTIHQHAVTPCSGSILIVCRIFCTIPKLLINNQICLSDNQILLVTCL